MVEILGKTGGKLIEVPYDYKLDQSGVIKDSSIKTVVGTERAAGIYDLLQSDKLIEIIEVHSAMSAMIVENCVVKGSDNIALTFDGLWSSSLTD